MGSTSTRTAPRSSRSTSPRPSATNSAPKAPPSDGGVQPPTDSIWRLRQDFRGTPLRNPDANEDWRCPLLLLAAGLDGGAAGGDLVGAETRAAPRPAVAGLDLP